jgi:hypothetical protein
MVSPDTVPL